MFETFLDVKEPSDHLVIRSDGKKDFFDYLNGKDFWDINRAAFDATVTAHSAKMPCVILEVGALDAYHFGQLFYFFQFACYLSGEILGINPFDQPGVEAYKGWMFKALGK
jgi:glucose-6-phosphate isomerase